MKNVDSNPNIDQAEMSDTPLQLKVDSRVIVQLGSELVSDEKQAILELVKNAYDADAAGCTIKIETNIVQVLNQTGEESLLEFNNSVPNVDLKFTRESVNKPHHTVNRSITTTGKITILDRGDGIPSDNLQNSWLVISNSIKRNINNGPKKTTKKGRTPLGDKGVGRLATMKLGDVLLLESSTSEESPIHQVYFRWGDCIPGKTLDNVPVFTSVIENSGKFKGTKIEILGLSHPEYWKSKTRLKELSTELTKLISPFEAVKTFPVKIELDGTSHELSSITNSALLKALARFSISWSSENQTLSLKAKIKKRIFRGNNKETQPLYDKYLANNTSDELLNYLQNEKRTKNYSLEKSSESDWYFLTNLNLNSDQISTSNEYLPFEDPGSFEAEIYFFHINNINEHPIDSSLDYEAKSDEKKLRGLEEESLRNSTGIAVLRDGFRIPLDGDWLNISIESTKGSSYGLRPGNIIGYFSLSGKENYKLVEKSDREAFVQNDAYRGFMRLAKRATKFANDFLEDVRRSTNEFLKDKENHNNAGNTPKLPTSFEDALTALPRTVENIKKTRDKIITISSRIKTETSNAKVVISEHKNDLATDPKSNQIATSIFAKLENSSNEIEAILGEVNILLDQVQSDHLSIVSIENKFHNLESQISALYESAAVGLSARSLVHDISTYTSEISASNTHIGAEVQKDQIDKKLVLSHISEVKSSVRELHNVVSLIDPMLPAQREIKDIFTLKSFVEGYFEKRRRTFEDSKINVSVTQKSNPSVKVNRGRMLQILDNLARNSQYWLKQNSNSEKSIHVEITEDGFIFGDNGPGISTIIEDSLFDLFVSDKPTSERGGVGLFIVQQLLQTFNGSIVLLPDRNTYNKRYKFYVELSAILISK